MDPAVWAEIEDLRQMKVVLCAPSTALYLGKNPDRRISSFCFVASLGACRLGRKEVSVSAHASERWRSLTMQTFASVPRRVFSRQPGPVTPHDHWIGREREEIDGFPFPAHYLPASLKTAGSSSRFLTRVLSINLSAIAR